MPVLDLAEVLTLQHGGPVARAIGFEYQGPARMVAGSLDHWSFRFVARAAIDAGARLAIAHRWPSDWGRPQSRDRQAVDFLEAVPGADTALRWWPARLHTWHPFDHVLFVELDDALPAGADVTVRFGGGPGGAGFRVQSYLEEGSPFSVRARLRDGEPWTEIAQHRIEVVGASAARIVAVAPSRVSEAAEVTLRIRIEDRWGNPATLPAPVTLEIGRAGAPDRHAELFGGSASQIAIGQVPRGTTRVHVAAPSLGLACTSNPIECGVDPAATPVYWADLHAQSVIGCGARSIDAYYAHARDFAALDACSHQANCFLVSTAEWDETARSSRRHHLPHRFVTLLGFEWSAASALGGDHNVYFPGDDGELRRCSHEFLSDRRDVATDLPHVEDFHRHYRASRPLVAVHVGGRTANLQWHEPVLDRLLEVHSTHATSEWFLHEALARGYRMGVIAGSDSVDGRPGNSHPGHMGVRNLRGGLTAILAPELTREALWDALERRHCYATTGARILLDFRHGDAVMGDDVVAPRGAASLAFSVNIEGTAGIESVDFFRDDVRIDRVDRFAKPPSTRLRVAWNGTSAPGNWQRARMRWDGLLRIEGETIDKVEGYAFDTPDEGITGHARDHVTWRSITAGDWDGVVLDLSAREGDLAFVTEPLTARVPLREIGMAGREIALANPARRLELRWLPQEAPGCGARLAFTDASPLAGTHAYWIRVRQVDGEFAWSSPIFVTMTEADS